MPRRRRLHRARHGLLLGVRRLLPRPHSDGVRRVRGRGVRPLAPLRRGGRRRVQRVRRVLQAVAELAAVLRRVREHDVRRVGGGVGLRAPRYDREPVE